MRKEVSVAVVLMVLSLAVVAGAAPALGSDFFSPASNQTGQQFGTGPLNPQRQDTPNDPDYDRSEPDTTLKDHSSSLYEERFDLFGFPSAITRLTALYLDPADPARLGQGQVSGFNAAGAWKIERGRPDSVIAILDTGIKWSSCGLRSQIHLDARELPLPRNASGNTQPGAPLSGYDLNGNGAVDVDDYAADSRVGRAFTTCDKKITGYDLIKAFSNHDDADANGYVDDIAGWNFFDNNNDPTDRSSYFAASNHGTGRANGAVEQGHDAAGSIGVCPRCQFTPIRIWDTFVSDGNNVGLGILYGTDNGAAVIEASNGSLYHSAFAEAASEYAYRHGLVQTFSGDDLNTGNHNYPANYTHAMLIEGTVPDSVGLGQDDPRAAQFRDFACKLPLAVPFCPGTNLPVLTYFRGANTTQFGGKSSISLEGATGSENTGKASGAAALVVAAGRDFSPGRPLSADETREILEQTAEDITPLNTQGLGTPDPSQPGFDTHFGYGRVNLGAAVQAIKDANIPPEASIDTPDWYAPLTGASVRLGGLARARRAPGGQFHYKLEWGTGLAPTSWRAVAEGNASGTRTDLGSVDLAAVRRALASASVPLDPAGPTFSSASRNPFKDQFTVRLTVTDPSKPKGLVGMDRKVLTALPDGQALRPGFPKRLGTGGEAPLRYADLNGDGEQELVAPTEDGKVHAYERNGSELRGWPVRTRTQSSVLGHSRAPAFRTGHVAGPLEPPRGPTIADLDSDGQPEVITAAGIHIYVWEPDGTLRPGFPVTSNPAFCRPEDESQDLHHRKCGFLATPAVGRLRGRGNELAIVASALDGHLYAYSGAGKLLSGFPFELVDPAIPDKDKMFAESINNPAIGDLNGDGAEDVVVASNETYGSAGSSNDVSFGAVSGSLTSANRVYAVSGATGKLLPGWPIKISGLIQDVLPLVGPGHDAAIATVNGQKRVLASATGTGASPVTGGLSTYRANGSLDKTMDQTSHGALSDATDPTPGLNLFESGIFADVSGDGAIAAVKYQLGAAAAANLLLVGQNLPYNHMMGAWNAASGSSLRAFPRVTDDYQFLSSPSVAKINPRGSSNQVLAGTGLGLLHAYDGVTGTDVGGFPKVTGGWLFAPAALAADGRLADITREGYLFEWNTRAPACQPEWPSFRHDPFSSGNHDTDGTPPGLAIGVERPDATHARFQAPGDDGYCGTASRYEIAESGSPISYANFDAAHRLSAPRPAKGGSDQTVTLPSGSSHNVAIRAVDDRGNVGPIAALRGSVLVSSPATCISRSRTGLRSNGIRSVRLRMTRAAVLRSLGLPYRNSARGLRYCVRGGGRVLVGLSPGGRVRLVLAGVPRVGLRGVVPGSSRFVFHRRFPKARFQGRLGLWLNGRDVIVLGRRGIMRYFGRADSGVRRSRSALFLYTRLAGAG